MKKEYRVYLVNINDTNFRDEMGDEEFIEVAEDKGQVYSLSGFEDALNDELSLEDYWTRIIKV